MIVDFICIGAGRTGTTWMYSLLSKNQKVGMALGKETNYFNHHFNKKSLDWYHGLFPQKGNHSFYGEISNNYYYEEGIAERIYSYNPSIKIIFSIREPLDLLLSIKGYADRRHLKFESVEDFLNTPLKNIMAQNLNDYNSIMKSNITVLESLSFQHFFKRFLECFPRENIFLFRFEELVHDEESVANSLYDFIGVKNTERSPLSIGKINYSSQPRLPFIGLLGSLVFDLLRLLRMDYWVGRIKRSKMIHSLFFKKNLNEEFRIELQDHFDNNPELKEKIFISYSSACSLISER